MANQGSPLDAHLVRRIRRLTIQGVPLRKVADLAGVSLQTVQKYTVDIREARRRYGQKAVAAYPWLEV